MAKIQYRNLRPVGSSEQLIALDTLPKEASQADRRRSTLMISASRVDALSELEAALVVEEMVKVDEGMVALETLVARIEDMMVLENTTRERDYIIEIEKTQMLQTLQHK